MRTIYFLLFSILTFFSSCHENDCNKIPTVFSSYDKAINFIKSRSFKLKDSIDVQNSQLMVSANYYSCDGQTGYFFFTRESGREHFCSKVPIELWMKFKKDESKETFYKNNISGKYTSVLILAEYNTIEQIDTLSNK